MQENRQAWKQKVREKGREALAAVLPVVAIVLVLCFTVAPVSASVLLCFLMGAALVTVGMMFFTLGAELSMTPMGERVGTAMTRSKKLWMILALGFLLGVIITVSEPDLQVLAGQVPSIPNRVLILSVAAGVGVFLMLALLRMLLGVPLVDEKEMVLIVVRSAQKDPVMRAIMDHAGLNSKAGTILFSLPVTDTAGMRLMEADAAEEAEND